MADYGLTIVSPNNSTKNATGSAVLLSAKLPFEKLDTTNPVSFQTINLFFSKDTPTPALGFTNKTLIYQFKHGYSYIPRFWMTVKNNDNTAHYLYGTDVFLPLVGGGVGVDSVYLNTEADATYINFYATKSNFFGLGASVASMSLTIRVYVFVDNIA